MEMSMVEDYGRWGGREHEDYIVCASAVVQDEDGGWEALNITRASGGGFGRRPGRARREKVFDSLGGDDKNGSE
jgi:hypothetical protein